MSAPAAGEEPRARDRVRGSRMEDARKSIAESTLEVGLDTERAPQS